MHQLSKPAGDMGNASTLAAKTDMETTLTSATGKVYGKRIKYLCGKNVGNASTS
ncbi:hypothetical protein ABU178_16285 [Pantoea osteomyelitidis]|uniref:Uncharacterized protein n=1 Tax=Pantoea osteomyelitidis TaxID=3230026 RepID=A0ABW7PZG9_9GAMM